MGYLERGYVILLTIAIVSGTWSYFIGNPSEGKIMHEKCWNSKYACENWSGDGMGYRHRLCRFRCKCKGFKSGNCYTNRECLKTSTENPWKCKCEEKQRFYFRIDCDQQTVGRRF